MQDNNHINELNLVMAAREGQDAAFEKLFIMYKEKIAYLVFQYVGNLQDAEDLLQEVFIKAFMAIKKFNPQPGATFFSWLYRIGINTSINYLKKQHKRNVIKVDKEIIDRVKAESKHTDPEHEAQMEEWYEHLQKGLTCLSPKQRMIFILKHFQDFKIEDISRFMNCSDGSVRKQLFRGISKLRKRLNYNYFRSKNEVQ